ncbi:DUF5753 domain-containing protein, partial [Streptomyces lunaelactis]|uniref:DUF5753 domain-containing protein n=2 Tax=Streptomyces lunaelactis TaxID=1535768 RepID=UPI0020C7C00B
ASGAGGSAGSGSAACGRGVAGTEAGRPGSVGGSGAAPLLTFVQEEATLRRQVGGRMVLRRQLEHLLEMGSLGWVAIQVMPTETGEHAGLAGSLRVLKLKDGTAVGHDEVQLTSRLVSDPKEVQILEMRYGMIRAQALTPRHSLAFIEKLRGET